MRNVKVRDMRRKRRALAAASTAFLLAFTLAGCGNPGNANSDAGAMTDGAEASANEGEPVPASQAFGRTCVWLQYDGDEQIGKDTEIKRVLSFDGDGNITVYEVDYIWMNGGSTYESLTFGDLDGLSDDEIVELAKQKDRERFDATRQSAIDETNSDIESGSGSPEYIDAAKAGQQVNEDAEYQEPEAVPYGLKIETDDTGNNVKLETLSFEYEALNSSHFYSGSHIGSSPDRYADEMLYETDDVDIDLYSPSYSTYSIVYDTAFGGFNGLATIVDEENANAGFTWDTLDTEGIEVD